MKFSIRKNWLESFELLIDKSIIAVPFVIITTLEILALEMLYFFPRKPLSLIFNPLVKRFFGEGFTHYPNSLLVLPKLFYIAQIMIFVFFSAFLTGMTVNLIKSIKEKLPVKPGIIIRNSVRRYAAFLTYGVVIMLSIYLAQRGLDFVIIKTLRVLSTRVPKNILQFVPLCLPIVYFLAHVFINTFLIMTIPILVIKRVNILKAFLQSLFLGFRYFFKIFPMLFVPYLVYLPVILLKNIPAVNFNKVFPESVFYISIIGIIIAQSVECFVTVNAANFVLALGKEKKA